jgi:predicted ATP-binding protein involved in virulence
MDVECGIRIGDRQHSYIIHNPREVSAPQAKKAGMPRDLVHETPETSRFLGTPPPPVTGNERGGRPLAVFFSTNRAIPSERDRGKTAAAGGIAAAYAEAFNKRELRLGEFASWMRAQAALKVERPFAGRVLGAFENAVARFLPGYANIRLDGDHDQRLLIDRGSTTVPVRLLSDGERGTLALVLDLTRRLAQANPSSADAAAEAEAVVLIDEIDLHLHPKWQRQIVGKLTTTFPHCQFIATTHSPQVIGEVAHDRIQIIADNQVYSPTHSFGVDSSRVLEEIMDASPRTRVVKEAILKLTHEIGRQQFEQARESLVELTAVLGEDDPEVTHARTLIDFMEGKE